MSARTSVPGRLAWDAVAPECELEPGLPSGLRVSTRAYWPESGDGAEPPVVPGFVESSFNPLVAQVADRCLHRRYGPVAEAVVPGRTAVVLVSRQGDQGTAAAVATAVDTGRRVQPLLFLQSVPNSVVGYIAARWHLVGPVLCLSPLGDPLRAAAEAAAVVFDDDDADEALLIIADHDPFQSGHDRAVALLVAPEPVVAPEPDTTAEQQLIEEAPDHG